MAEVLSKAISLLAECSLKSLSFKNRIVMSALPTHNCLRGAPTPAAVKAYMNRAHAGLIITEGTAVSKETHTFSASAALYNKEHVEGWKKLVDAAHKKDSKIFAQLTHWGRACMEVSDGKPLAPSALPIRGDYISPVTHSSKRWAVPREMHKDEIKRVVEDFVKAARLAWKAGFDGVEIDAGHGCLLDTFLRSSTNQRFDEYGGSAMGRCRFPLEVLEAVMSVYGYRTGIKLTPVSRRLDVYDEKPLETYLIMLKKMELMKVGFVELREPVLPYNGSYPAPKIQMPKVCQALRHHFNGKIICSGPSNFESANLAIFSGDADMVSFETPLSQEGIDDVNRRAPPKEETPATPIEKRILSHLQSQAQKLVLDPAF